MPLTIGTRRALLATTSPAVSPPPPEPTVPGTPVEIATQRQESNTTGDYTITFTANAAVGELAVLVMASTALSGTLTLAATDSAGNTWTLVKSTTLNTRRQAVYQSVLTSPIVGGATAITANGSASGRIAVCGFKCANVAVVDVNSNGTFGTATSSSISSGGQTTADQLIIGWVWVANTTGWAESTVDAFTTLSSAIHLTNFMLRVSYKIVSATDSVTYAPGGWGNAAYATSILSWKA